MKYFKLNQTVYHPVYGEGEVISINHDFMDCRILVKFKKSTISFREDGSDYHTKAIVLSQTPIPEIVNKPLEDTYIPFTFEDRELLRGKWIRSNNHKNTSESVIMYLSETRVATEDSGYSYSQLLEMCEFLDGKPCGKLGN